MFEYLATFVELVKSVPEIVGVLLEIRTMWNTYLTESERRENIVKFREALKNAHERKDSTQLTSLVNDILARQPNK